MLRVRTLSLAEVVICLAVSTSFAVEHTKESLADVKKNVEREKAVLVDVREKAEWDKGHIEGSVLLPMSALREGIDEKELQKKLPEDKVAYTFCVVGKRALAAGEILKKLGYEVRPLRPGYKGLLKAGFKKAKEEVSSNRE